MRILFIISIVLCGIISNAETYRANDPAWRGEWIWAPRKNTAPVLDVNLRDWLESRPGGWGQSLVNRILGNAAIAGIGKVFWRLDDGRGNALFPCKDNSLVLKWENWGVDFSKFDFPKAAEKFARRCGMDIVFVTNEKFFDSAKELYPELQIRKSSAFDGKLIKAEKMEPAQTAVRWFPHGKYEFKKAFKVTGKIKKARMCITADAAYRVYIDDKAVGRDSDWWRGETYDVSSLLTPGTHVVRAVVESSRSYAGLLVNLEWISDKDGKRQLNTGADWLCRKVGKNDWQPVSITGYTGTGPRFRIKDPWMNPRKLICDLRSKDAFVDDSLMIIKKNAGQIYISLKRPVLLTEIRFKVSPKTNWRFQVFEEGKWKNITSNSGNNTGTDTNVVHAFTPRTLSKLRLVDVKGVVKNIKLIKAQGAK